MEVGVGGGGCVNRVKMDLVLNFVSHWKGVWRFLVQQGGWMQGEVCGGLRGGEGMSSPLQLARCRARV